GVLGRAIAEGRPTRVDDLFAGSNDVAHLARKYGIRTLVSYPIVVHGETWGALSVGSRIAAAFPPETETFLSRFSDLVATAIANAEAGVALRAAADEQGALRRVATLVAASAAPSDVFAAVTEEIARVLGADACMLCRVDTDGAAVVVGTWADGTPEPAPGTRIARGGTNL